MTAMSKKKSPTSSKKIQFHIVTLFPGAFDSYLKESIIGRAIKDKKIKVSFYNPRDFSKDKHKRIDRRPYGGGPGMVIEAEPVLRAWEKAVGRKKDKKKVKTLIMSPRGKEFDQKMAKKFAKQYDHLVLISGRYEGIDHRVRKILKAQEVSVGDYILTGGELPALTIIDSVARHIPGVLGKHESLEDERAASAEIYTRPEILEWKKKKYKVPKVLVQGNHAAIEKWRKKKDTTKT